LKILVEKKNKNKMDIFLSYNWNIKEQVKLFHEELEKENFKVWRDDKQLHAGNNALTAELAKGIKESKVFICCITKDYCKSNNCNLEIEFASSCKKQMIVLMIDKIEPTEIDEIQVEDRLKYSGIGFIIL
jgi:hypothetical protein